jgi:ubiquinone/menaquinone biosynthesis C-methylase UbiE
MRSAMSEPVSFGYQTVDPDEKTRRVGAVFSNVAAKYDLMNDAMSGGLHRLWKDQFVRRVKPRPGEAIAFGIRNVTHIDKALAEAFRVLRFGGRFFCLEFSTTEWPGFKDAYDFYSHTIVPRLGKVIARDEDSYRYLVESIRRFPPMPEFERMIRAAGFERTRVEPILGGLVAIHSGWKI